MNIGKLNPIGYEAQTKDGNSYKKSNLGKTAMLAGYAGLQVAANTVAKNTKFVKNHNFSAAEKEIGQLLNKPTFKISKKAKPFAIAAAMAFDIALALGVGKLIDKGINHINAKKADAKAAEAAKNVEIADAE